MNDYMKKALKEANKAYSIGEIPVGAVIVKNGKVIAKAHNLKEKHGLVTSHAEIIALQKACKKQKNWRLCDCEIYVTLEPCMMCLGAIVNSRIRKIYYGASNSKFNITKFCDSENIKVTIYPKIMEYQCSILLKNFFSSKR